MKLLKFLLFIVISYIILFNSEEKQKCIKLHYVILLKSLIHHILLYITSCCITDMSTTASVPDWNMHQFLNKECIWRKSIVVYNAWNVQLRSTSYLQYIIQEWFIKKLFPVKYIRNRVVYLILVRLYFCCFLLIWPRQSHCNLFLSYLVLWF